MAVKKDISGQTFGRLTVIAIGDKTKQGHNKWICLCECGNLVQIEISNLINGNTKSCGCYRIEITRKKSLKHGNSINRNPTDEYTVWVNIKDRCYNAANRQYKHYGGRGIAMCDRWVNDFDNFLNDMGRRPSAKHSIDRYPNFNGDYEPNNCRWAISSEQARCKRNNVWIEYGNRKMVEGDWAIFFGVSQSNLQQMLKGKPFKDAYEYYMGKNSNPVFKRQHTLMSKKKISDKNKTITDEQIEMAKIDICNGLSLTKAANKNRISRSHLSRILNRGYKRL